MKAYASMLVIILLSNSFSNAVARSKSKMPVQPIKLYYLPPSPPCRAVMMTARVLGVDLELVTTNIMKGEHMTPEFLKMNPQHTIPTIDDSGFILWESRAIMTYLTNASKKIIGAWYVLHTTWRTYHAPITRAIMTYLANAYGKDDSLYPKNPRLRALVDQRLNFDLGTLFQRYANLYIPILFSGAPYSDENGAKLDEALGWLNTFLDGRAFVAGENLTIADITIVVTITNIDAFGYDFSAHENVTKWFERTKMALDPYGYNEIDVAGAQMLASYLKKE